MESLVWRALTTDVSNITWPLMWTLALLLTMCPDYVIVLASALWARATSRREPPRDHAAPLPAVLIVVPSLLRVRDELTSMISTIRSITDNGYPGDLTAVVSIDGTQDAPHLYAELQQWASEQKFGLNTRLWVTGTNERRSKPMAIDHAIQVVSERVARGELPAFPPVYISTDADADLGARAIEHIVCRLLRRNPITGWPARAVAGALHVRGNEFWKGWRHFFSVRGQLNLQVAREYFVGNMWRYNIRWLPITGVPGAFYCTWSEIFIAIPHYMGYLRTLRTRDWLAWWVGVAPPKFSESTAAPIPELMAGDTDDTVTAYAAVIARWDNGAFTFDPPRTPLHAFYHLLRGYFVDRALKFEPRAHVFTSSPTSVKTLFKQRKRWNSSRVELTGRFWPALCYHWTLGLPALVVKFLIAQTIIVGLLVYSRIPEAFWRSTVLWGFAFGYFAMTVNYAVATFFSLSVRGFAHWQLLYALPVAPLYQLIFNWLPGVIGVTSDVLFFGNRTGFAPEQTLIRGGSSRIALLFRLRRALLLTLRSALMGDVPLGKFWFGWGQTPWAPSGFEGFTSGVSPRPILFRQPAPKADRYSTKRRARRQRTNSRRWPLRHASVAEQQAHLVEKNP